MLGVIKEMEGGRAPGPDGFTGKYYKSCWAIIKVDLLAALRAVQANATTHLDRLNNATMILLPKKADAQSPKDFWSINLVGSFTKIVTKIMANVLRKHMQGLVRPSQNTFIKGRSIHDNYEYVSGLAKSLRKVKMPALIIKLDIEQAFDMVSWGFILKLLQWRGFGPRWRSWMAALLSSSSTRILING